MFAYQTLKKQLLSYSENDKNFCLEIHTTEMSGRRNQIHETLTLKFTDKGL